VKRASAPLHLRDDLARAGGKGYSPWQMTEPTRNYDLSAVGRELDQLPWGRKLGGIIRRINDRRSAEVDLDNVEEALHRLAAYSLNLQRKTVPSAVAAIEGLVAQSLSVYSIIVYARVTMKAKSRGKDRSNKGTTTPRLTVEVEPWLNDQQKLDHLRMIALRNSFFAHFNVDEASGGWPWVREFLCLETHGHITQFTFPYLRADFYNDDMRKLQQLVRHIKPRLLKNISDLEENLQQELVQSGHVDDFMNLLLAREVNLSEWYGIPDFYEGEQRSTMAQPHWNKPCSS
jgi:hypothetical protein